MKTEIKLLDPKLIDTIIENWEAEVVHEIPQYEYHDLGRKQTGVELELGSNLYLYYDTLVYTNGFRFVGADCIDIVCAVQERFNISTNHKKPRNVWLPDDFSLELFRRRREFAPNLEMFFTQADNRWQSKTVGKTFVSDYWKSTSRGTVWCKGEFPKEHPLRIEHMP